MSDFTIRVVFITRCYGKDEDDPWVYLKCLRRDYLPERMRPQRMDTARHVLALPQASWYRHVAIDPCASLLPKSVTRLEEQQVAALGDSRYMSKGARREGINLRAPDTAKRQSGSNVLTMHWTPVFCIAECALWMRFRRCSSRRLVSGEAQ